MSILLVNVGNTNTTIAVSKRRAISVHARQPGGHDRRAMAAVLRRVTRCGSVDDSVLCSVVPSATRLWRQALRARFGREPLIVGPRLRLGFRIDYPNPKTIGADRLANVCAAANERGGGAIIVDTGTATTFNVLTRDMRFIGGAIAPGVAAFSNYLSERTALLPKINPLRGRCPRIGRSTKGALRLGLQAGYRGMLSEIVGALRAVVGAGARVLVTGGFARRARFGREVAVRADPLLTLRGMAWAYELNRAGGVPGGGKRSQRC